MARGNGVSSHRKSAPKSAPKTKLAAAPRNGGGAAQKSPALTAKREPSIGGAAQRTKV